MALLYLPPGVGILVENGGGGKRREEKGSLAQVLLRVVIAATPAIRGRRSSYFQCTLTPLIPDQSCLGLLQRTEHGLCLSLLSLSYCDRFPSAEGGKESPEQHHEAYIYGSI